MVGICIFRDLEILLHSAAGVGQKRPSSPDGSAKLICLEQVVGRDRHETAVADLHLAVELQQAFVLSPLLWTETPAGEH